MTRIVLLRHALAEPVRNGQVDGARPLAPLGRLDAARSADRLSELLRGWPVRVFTSPKIRARETAEILADALGGLPVEELEGLGRGQEPDLLLRSLPSPDGGRDRVLVLVGHEPDVGRLLARLLDPAWQGTIPFPAGGYAIVELEGLPPRGPARLVAFGRP